MREIKFRGYAVEKMVHSQWLHGFGVDSIEYAEHYAKEIGRKRDWYLYTDSGAIHVHEKSIGQYTGLTDRNGKEIYEGDIVSGRNGATTRESYFVGDVVFGKGGFGYRAVRYEGSYPPYMFRAKDILSICNNELIEVIGNIYGNPELIEEAK